MRARRLVTVPVAARAHLPKLRVGGSSPVVRSSDRWQTRPISHPREPLLQRGDVGLSPGALGLGA